MSDGNWVTINGVHVLIGGSGEVEKGPANFIGKTVDEIKGKGAKSAKESDTKTKGSQSTTANKGNKDMLPDYDNMTDSEALQKLSEQGINSIETAIEKQGCNPTPKVMSSEDFDNYVSKEKPTVLSRGISADNSKTSDKYVDELKYGDFYISGGEAYFGQGMYAFGGDSVNQASNYAKGSGGKVITMAIPKDAKVLEVNGKNGLRSEEVINTFYNKDGMYNKNNKFKEFEPFVTGFGLADKLEKLGYKLPKEPDDSLIFKDLSKYLKQEAEYKNKLLSMGADYLRKTLPEKDCKLLFDSKKNTSGNNIITASRGYDAIKLSKEYVNENSSHGLQEIWIVLNRGKLVIKED